MTPCPLAVPDFVNAAWSTALNLPLLCPTIHATHLLHTEQQPLCKGCCSFIFMSLSNICFCFTILCFSFPKNYLSFFLSRIAIASFDIGTRMMRFIIVIRPIPTSPRSQTTVYSCKPPIKSITSAIIL